MGISPVRRYSLLLTCSVLTVLAVGCVAPKKPEPAGPSAHSLRMTDYQSYRAAYETCMQDWGKKFIKDNPVAADLLLLRNDPRRINKFMDRTTITPEFKDLLQQMRALQEPCRRNFMKSISEQDIRLVAMHADRFNRIDHRMLGAMKGEIKTIGDYNERADLDTQDYVQAQTQLFVVLDSENRFAARAISSNGSQSTGSVREFAISRECRIRESGALDCTAR